MPEGFIEADIFIQPGDRAHLWEAVSVGFSARIIFQTALQQIFLNAVERVSEVVARIFHAT